MKDQVQAATGLFLAARRGVPILVLGLMSACTSEFPFREEATVSFQENRPALQELITLFESGDFEMVLHGGSQAIVHVRRIGVDSQDELTGEAASRLRLALDAAGLKRIANDRGNGNYTLVPKGNAAGANPRYFIEYVFGEKLPDAPNCDEQRPAGELGMCVINLSQNWWLSYTWVH